jgi:hypothetical protein
MNTKVKIIDDVVTIEEYKRGINAPDLPIPNENQLVAPCHLDRLPDEIKAEIQKKYMIDEETPQAISTWLQEKGYMVWKLKLAHWCESSFKKGEDKTDALLLEKNRLEMERKGAYMMMAVAMESIKKMRALEITKPKEYESIVGAYARLISALAQRDRVEFEKTSGVEKAKEMIVYEIRKSLASRPELMTQLYEIIESSSEQVKLQIDR